MSEIAIKVENISKVYKLYDKPVDRLKESINPFKKKYHRDFFALNNISFEIEKGETLGIIGKNGSGKSTLLKIITGVLNPTSGNAVVNGKISALLELGAGFNTEFTGIENIYLNGTIMGYTKEEMDRKIPKIIEFADIGDFINQPVKTYSSGMFVRLAFSVAINVEPDILIVDEALAVGDMAFQAKCITKMKQLIEKGITVLFVTHDIGVIKKMCTRCVYLIDGKVNSIGSASDIADQYLYDTREAMNKENILLANYNDDKYKQANPKINDNLNFKEDDNYFTKIGAIRQGTGDVVTTFFEVVDNNNEVVQMVDFNQDVTLRIYLKFLKDCEVTVGYHIRDNRNVEMIGSSILLEERGLINGKVGDRFIVEFKTKLPLRQGIYNVTTVVSTPVIKNRTAVFIDYIENAFLFEVLERKPVVIWNAVYIKNECNINKVNSVKKCSVCGSEVDSFVPLAEHFYDNYRKYGYPVDKVIPETLNRAEYSCPICGASDRERLYVLYLKQKLDKINNKKLKLIDIAPSATLTRCIKSNFNINYITADLYMKDVDYSIDLTDMDVIKDETFDAFICSHVLEHIPNDMKALSELYRILKKDGFGILMVPIDLAMKEIDEDVNTTVEERWRRFGQDDHIRKYSKDGFIKRVKDAGFKVSQLGIDFFGKDKFAENSIQDRSILYVVEKI